MADASRCARCGAKLSRDEIALTKKLVNRGASAFWCVPCLAEHFQVPPETLLRKITEFKAMGCTLFDP